jgi:hypothetical protein
MCLVMSFETSFRDNLTQSHQILNSEMLICLFVVFMPGHGCSMGHSEDLAMGVFGIKDTRTYPSFQSF